MAKKERDIKLEGKTKHGEISPVRKHILNEGKAGIRGDTPQGGTEVLNVDTPAYQDQVQQVYELLMQGISTEEIYAMLLMDHDDMGRDYFKILCRHAYTIAENNLHKDREYVFQLHMDRYEKMYEQSLIMTNFWGVPLDKKKDWKIIVARYGNAIRALKAKEDLLGLHDKSVVIEFNDGQATVLEPENNRGKDGIPGYNIDNLSLEEKVEMLQLIQQSRTVPIEGIQRVVVKSIKIEINPQTGERVEIRNTQNIDKVETHDISFEEMPEDVVSKFEKIPDPEMPIETMLGPQLIDHAGDKKGSTVDQIKQNIQEKLKKHLAEKLKRERS